MVVPAVTRAVVLGSSGATVDVVLEEHRKVASRAVYVLTQKAVVSGCPLTDQGTSLHSCFYLPHL